MHRGLVHLPLCASVNSLALLWIKFNPLAPRDYVQDGLLLPEVVAKLLSFWHRSKQWEIAPCMFIFVHYKLCLFESIHRYKENGVSHVSFWHAYTVRIKKKVILIQRPIVLKSINLNICMWPISKEQLIYFPLVPFLHHVCHAWPSTLPLKMTMSYPTFCKFW